MAPVLYCTKTDQLLEEQRLRFRQPKLRSRSIARHGQLLANTNRQVVIAFDPTEPALYHFQPQR